MNDQEWQTLHGVLMTSERIDAYGGIRIPGEVLREMASEIEQGPFPFHIEHDLSRPIRARNFTASVETRSDGIDELKFSVEIHPEDAVKFESMQKMSATIMTPIDRDAHAHPNRHRRVRLGADHAWFDDEALVAAEERLVNVGVRLEDLSIERALQFSQIPDPQIFLTIVYPILSSIGASAIWDAIKLLLRRRKTPRGGDDGSSTILNVTVTEGERSLTASIATNDAGVAERAFESLDNAVNSFFQGEGDGSGLEALEPKAILVWDEQNRRWQPPSG